MSQVSSQDYHFCTLSELQSPKQLPSLDFVSKILTICHVPMTLFESPQRNIYDRKNHILYINNYDSYSRTLKEKYGRSVASFEKQLKMMGFKKRKTKQHSDQSFTDIKIEANSEGQRVTFNEEGKTEGKRELSRKVSIEEQMQNNRMFNTQICQIKKQNNHPIKYMFVWRTNRPVLIERELESLELAFSQEVERAIALKEEMEKRKKNLDSKLETIILHSLLSSQENCFAQMETEVSSEAPKKQKLNQKNETILEKCLKQALKQLKVLSNESQIQSRKLVKSISQNSSQQLQLFRILIYKETHIHKSVEEE